MSSAGGTEGDASASSRPARRIDHLVLPVRDLGGTRERLSAFGFTVAPDARHPFGTGNACVFFRNRTYLEPLAVLDEEAARQAEADGLFFVTRARQFLAARGEGFAMLALKAEDAEAAHHAFTQAGVSAGRMFQFSRQAAQPDGSQKEIGVRLAFSADPRAPDATFFACQPIGWSVNNGENFADHPNGALGVTGVAGVARDPADFRAFLAAVLGTADIRAEPDGLHADLGDAAFALLTPDAFADAYGVAAPDPGPGFALAAFEVRVSDLGRAETYVGGGAIQRRDRMIVPPAPGLGAILVFVESPA